jgi:hypothetical protein
MAVSLVVGLLGGWSLWAAASQYNSTIETYTEIDIAYQPGSFVWLDPTFHDARLTMVVTNDSPADATVQNLDVFLRFDGEFAGTNYARFAPLVVERGASRAIELEIQVSTPSVQARGGTAMLTLDGSSTIDFDGIRRELTLNVNDEIGVVPWMES